jgi:hypothetical protein
LEELLYWGAIAGFYLWSAYRSNQKKAKRLVPSENPAKKDLKNPQIPNNQEINVLDFLNRAFEESKTPEKEEAPKRAMLSSKSEHAIQDKFLDHFDSKHDLSTIDDRHLDNIKIKDQHLDNISSRLNHKVKQVIAKKEKPLELIQKKYIKNPTKLAMTMQAIFEQPKAMQ